MKQYLVFAGDQYYPCGGWKDFVDSYNTIEEALESLATSNQDWWQIVDSTSGELIKYG